MKWRNILVSTLLLTAILPGTAGAEVKQGKSMSKEEWEAQEAEKNKMVLEIPTTNTPVKAVKTDSESEVVFTDIEGVFSKDQILSLAKRGIVTGTDGKFRPYENVTMSQVIALVARSVHAEMRYHTELSKVKVSKDHWNYKNILEMETYYAFTGMDPSSLNIEKEINRIDTASMIYKALEWTLSSSSVHHLEYNTVTNFKDSQSLTPNQIVALNGMNSLGLFTGKTSDTFDPHGKLTRAQMAKVIHRLLEIEDTK